MKRALARILRAFLEATEASEPAMPGYSMASLIGRGQALRCNGEDVVGIEPAGAAPSEPLTPISERTDGGPSA